MTQEKARDIIYEYINLFPRENVLYDINMTAIYTIDELDTQEASSFIEYRWLVSPENIEKFIRYLYVECNFADVKLTWVPDDGAPLLAITNDEKQDSFITVLPSQTNMIYDQIFDHKSYRCRHTHIRVYEDVVIRSNKQGWLTNIDKINLLHNHNIGRSAAVQKYRDDLEELFG